MSRFHLAIVALRFSGLARERIATLTDELRQEIANAEQYARDHFEDPPEIRDWTWDE
jgi:xylulose-5-phosphate/fructose-6-phosphate phosphoketolase